MRHSYPEGALRILFKGLGARWRSRRPAFLSPLSLDSLAAAMERVVTMSLKLVRPWGAIHDEWRKSSMTNAF